MNTRSSRLNRSRRRRRASSTRSLVQRGQTACASCSVAGSSSPAKPSPIQVMQLQRLDAGDPVVLAPAIGRQIRTAAHQPVQHGEENRPFQAKPCWLPGQVVDHRPAAGLGRQSARTPRPARSAASPRRVVLNRGHHHRRVANLAPERTNRSAARSPGAGRGDRGW